MCRSRSGALVCAAPALAQRPRPDRPYRGLFGGNGADPNSTQALDLNVSLSGAYDDNVLASARRSAHRPALSESGNYERRHPLARLHQEGRPRDVRLHRRHARTATTRPSSQMNGTDSFASVGVSAKLSRRPRHPRHRERELPAVLFAGGHSRPAGGAGRRGAHHLGLPAGSRTRHSPSPRRPRSTTSVTARSSLSADYRVRLHDYRASAAALRQLGCGRLGYSYKLNSRTSMRLGYHYSNYDNTVSGVNQPHRSHDITFGMDYTEPLSPRAAMTLGFSVGTSLYTRVPLEGAAVGSVYVEQPVPGDRKRPRDPAVQPELVGQPRLHTVATICPGVSRARSSRTRCRPA